MSRRAESMARRYSRSRSRYQSIASTSAGRRSAAPPGKLPCGIRANTSKRSAPHFGRLAPNVYFLQGFSRHELAGNPGERNAVAGEALQEVDVGGEPSEMGR